MANLSCKKIMQTIFENKSAIQTTAKNLKKKISAQKVLNKVLFVK